MTSLRFPTCWDGKNLDSPDHMSHMSYPEIGTFESAGPCPASHPVRMSQVMFEVVWDTKPFNDLEWPADGSSPFVWSFGDATGYGNHADYVFGWKGNALQRILDTPCYFNCPDSAGKKQSIEAMNRCKLKPVVDEDIDSCKCRCRGCFGIECRYPLTVYVSESRAPRAPRRLCSSIWSPVLAFSESGVVQVAANTFDELYRRCLMRHLRANLHDEDPMSIDVFPFRGDAG